MQITEPMTMVSDYLLAAFAVLLALRAATAWPLVVTGIDPALGICPACDGGRSSRRRHVARILPSLRRGRPCCRLEAHGLLGRGGFSLLMLGGSIIASVPRWLRQWLVAAAVIQFAVYAVWMLTHDEFVYVELVPKVILCPFEACFDADEVGTQLVSFA